VCHILTLQVAMDERRPCDMKKGKSYIYCTEVAYTYTRRKEKKTDKFSHIRTKKREEMVYRLSYMNSVNIYKKRTKVWKLTFLHDYNDDYTLRNTRHDRTVKV